MKKELSPAVLIGALVLAVIVLCSFGYKMLQAPGYEPSPGVGGAPATSGYSGQNAPVTTSSVDGAAPNSNPAPDANTSDPRGPNMPPPNVVPGVMRSQKQ